MLFNSTIFAAVFLPVLDIYPVLHGLSVARGVRPRWLDDGHWTEEAYRAVGRRIAKEINSLRQDKALERYIK